MEEKPRFERPTSLEEEHKLTLERSAYLLKHIADQNEQIDFDHLTGLKNRRAFELALKKSLSLINRGQLGEVSLISLDIDHFKRVNDLFGHPAGDEVLQKVATFLTKSVRDADLVARVGGEEITILLQGTDEEAAAKKADDLRMGIAELTFDKCPERVTASFGVISSMSSTDEAMLVDNVDKTLYTAKHNGRNRVERYTLMGA